MMRKLVVSRNAETDLILIWIYYAEKSEQAAQRIRREIISKYNLLLQFPLLGRSRDDLQEGLRSIPVGNYIIFYQEIEDKIEIVRVLHGALDLQSVFALEYESEEDRSSE